MDLAPVLADKHILIVEDDMSIRHLIKVSLRTYGFRHLHEAVDGERAVAKLKTVNVDLIISDWDMPNMDGIGLFKSVQSDEKNKDKPFILLTKHNSKEKVSEAVSAGISLYVIKPFTPEKVINKVLEVLK